MEEKYANIRIKRETLEIIKRMKKENGAYSKYSISDIVDLLVDHAMLFSIHNENMDDTVFVKNPCYVKPRKYSGPLFTGKPFDPSSHYRILDFLIEAANKTRKTILVLCEHPYQEIFRLRYFFSYTAADAEEMSFDCGNGGQLVFLNPSIFDIEDISEKYYSFKTAIIDSEELRIPAEWRRLLKENMIALPKFDLAA